MQLSPRQLSTLNEMGIPVWELRQQTIEHIQLEQQQCVLLILLEQQDQLEPAQRLLQAMLSTIGLSQQDIVFVTQQQLPQLKNNVIEQKLIFALGIRAAQSLLGMDIKLDNCRGKIHQVLDSQFTAVVSFGLEELLKTPENKAQAWQDLKLAKQAFEKFG